MSNMHIAQPLFSVADPISYQYCGGANYSGRFYEYLMINNAVIYIS
jgi:hypothetical protein